MQPQQQTNKYRPKKNHQIKAASVRLINADGTNVGVLPLNEALKRAREAGLDLVEINSKSVPPVAKLADYGKMLFEEKKKAAAARKAQKQSELKELIIRPNIGDNDLLIKLNAAKQFLQDGDKVKLTVKFRGREITHPQVGREKLEWILQEVSTLIAVVPQISSEGKFMFMIISPK